MCNYIIGYDVINSIFEGPKRPSMAERSPWKRAVLLTGTKR